MDHDAGWRPCEFQLANWVVQEPAAEGCSPAAGLPVEYASIDIFGTCSLPQSSGGQQLVEYYNSAAARHNWSPEVIIDGQYLQEVMENSCKQVVDLQNVETKARKIVSNDSHARDVLKQVGREFEDDMDLMKTKMHRYPASLRGLDESYTVPRIVAIGPYHRHRDHLLQAEKVKHMAAICCVQESGLLLEELYSVVASAADSVRHLYDKDVMAGIGYDDFRHMMFFDSCFLVQYMRLQSRINIDGSLRDFLGPNKNVIGHDIKLLENQIPWEVVEVVLIYRPVPLDRFISFLKGYLQHHKLPKEDDSAVLTLDENYKPPHLLGLLRYYTVGRSHGDTKSTKPKPKKRSISVSANELAQIGITLTANKTMELIHMDLNLKGKLFAELTLAPLSLDRNRASYLVNMAALELCTVKSFAKAEVEDSAVCSYILLLANMVYREEDVHELRAKGLLQGGRGLTNAEALRFFTSFQGMRLGPCYNRVMRDIEIYKENRRMQTKLYAFFYNNKKIIATVVTGIGVLVGIIGALLSVKKSV